jgi:hypothetical protein
MKKILLTLVFISFFSITFANAKPTWSGEVACIVYSHCSNCHNPNGINPNSMLTYQEVRNNTYAMTAYIGNKYRPMPPSIVDESKVKYAHHNSLSQDEINTLIEWINSDAPEGDPSQAPTAPTFTGGGEIANPDLVLTIPKFEINTEIDLYRCFVLPTNLTSNRAIQEFEIIPGNRNAVHHVLLFQDTSMTPFLNDLKDPGPGYTSIGGTGSNTSKLINGYTPGQTKFVYPQGFGANLDAKTNLVMQIHYPAGIVDQSDSTQIRIKFAESTVRNVSTNSLLDHGKSMINGPLFIPANTKKTFYNRYIVNSDATLFGVLPHMHLIGKSIRAVAVTPNKDTIELVNIPYWDFHWQKAYQFQKPIVLKKGTVILGQADYDNTDQNSENPHNPPIDVSLGEATTDEMFLIYFNYTGYKNGDENILVDDHNHYEHYQNCQVSTGIEDADESINDFELKSNLVFDDFSIKSKSSEKLVKKSNINPNLSIEMYDALGKMVKKFENVNIEQKNDISDLQKGCYMIKVQSNSQVFQSKLLKN